MDGISGLYRIINKINEKFYIGSTNDFDVRWKRHSLKLEKNCHDNPHLQRAWNKYGKDNFIFKIYALCDPINLLIEEQKELDIWVGNPLCYNIRKDARCPVTPGEHRSEEIKLKISLAQKGKPKWNDAQREWFRQLNLGRKHSQETIKKLKLRNHTPETKEKISKASKNQEWSLQRCKNISIGKLKNKHNITEIERKNISDGVQKAITEGRYHKNKVPLNEYETIKSLYLSGSMNKRQLAFKYGINPSSMNKLLKRIGI